MYFPRYLVGMFVTSVIVAVWAGFQTGSGWQALGWATLALIILQAGYLGLVVHLIYRPGSKGAQTDLASENSLLPMPRIRRSQPPSS
ncbi:hypothetical protein AU467_13180 [Mesorhizobium loti]|uniref:Exopolysaccharide production repressor exox n=1 Tax=Rhizobium loti TaxID=381 RepID=A0A117N4G5_RHILI|nr:hypothetical protein AU467_13180 [Mesorhizobium loti]